MTHNFITPMLSAFISRHSTQIELYKIINDLLESTDDGLVPCLYFFDISKCFDSISYDGLLLQLHKYGVHNVEHDWFRSYLTDRKQITVFNGSCLSTQSLSYGIPQGSVLGPCSSFILTTLLALSSIQQSTYMLMMHLYMYLMKSGNENLQNDIDSAL